MENLDSRKPPEYKGPNQLYQTFMLGVGTWKIEFIVTLSLVFSILVYLLAPDLELLLFRTLNDRETKLQFAGFLIYVTTMLLIFVFYQGTKLRRKQTNPELSAELERRSSGDLELLRKETTVEISQQIKKLVENLGEEKFRQEVSAALKIQLDKTLTNDLVKSLSEKFKSDVVAFEQKSQLQNYLVSEHARGRGRILEMANDESKAAVIYRYLGLALMLAGLALAVLRFLGLFKSAPADALLSQDFAALHPALFIAVQNVPFISLVLFIEFLALLLFRLHRRSNENQRYYSSEAVNLDLRYVSAQSAVLQGTPRDLSEVISALAWTERNPILEGNQQTIQNLHNESEKDDVRDAANIFSGAIRKATKSIRKPVTVKRSSKTTGK